jgi:hypothetical protein
MVSMVKQVAGEDRGGLLAQECPPGGGCRPRCRIGPVAAQRRADRGCRVLHAHPKQLALDRLVAPARIFPGQMHDQRLHLLIQRRSPWSARIGPGAGDQATVPAQQRLRLDKEAGPARSGQDAADRSQQGTVGGLEPGPWDLAAQDAELVA